MASVRSGAWSDPATWTPARVPAAGDRVTVAGSHTVVYDVVGNEAMRCVGVDGTLRFRTDADTRLVVGDLLVRPKGTLEIGTAERPVAPERTATIVIADQPIDTAQDPEQFGTGLVALGRVTIHGAPRPRTFLRLSEEPAAGAAVLLLEEPAVGWQPGDRIIVPDSRFLSGALRGAGYTGVEVAPIRQVEGRRLHLSVPLRVAHPGARDADGTLEFLPHVGNLTRNVLIRSQNPNGTRGHTLFVARAEVDIRHAAFVALGRTTNEPLDITRYTGSRATHIGTNQIGRYAVHFHHLFGPMSSGGNGYQYVFAGNVIEDAMKWGITVHNTHYGLVADNVLFGTRGSAIMTEDGNESFNVIERNFVVGVEGDGNRGDQGAHSVPPGLGSEGTGIWLRGPNNYVRDNVVANARMYGYMLFFGATPSELNMPAHRGADPSERRQGRALDFEDTPVLEFAGNEVYASTYGVSAWYVHTSRPSVLARQRVWHPLIGGFEGYPTKNLVLDGWVIRGDPNGLANLDEWTAGVAYGDYYSQHTVLIRADIQNMRYGVLAALVPGDPWAGARAPAGVSTIEDSRFRNYQDILVMTPYFTGGGPQMSPRVTVVRNSVFGPAPVASRNDNPSAAIQMMFRGGANSNVSQVDRVLVYGFNGDPNDDFEVFYLEQAPGFVVPPVAGAAGGLKSGLTNEENWQQGGAAIAGQVAPCQTRRPEVAGFVCPPGPPPAGYPNTPASARRP